MTSHPRHAEPYPLGGDDLPYSKGSPPARSSPSASPPCARTSSRRIEEDLASRGETAATLDRIEELADDDVTMRRLRRYLALRELDLVIVLLGGATGTGKSTVATELAYRLGITRVTSTDFIRQTMRAFFARLHAVDPLLELRGGTRAPKARGGVRPGDRRLPRPVARRARRRARVARPGARGGLVDGARRRASRAGPRRAAARRSRPSSRSASSRSRSRTRTRRTSTSATRTRTACAPSRATSTASTTSAASSASSSRARAARRSR